MIEKFKTLFFVKSSLISLYLALTIPLPFISIEKLKIPSIIIFALGLYLIINITSDYVETCSNKISYKSSFISKFLGKKNWEISWKDIKLIKSLPTSQGSKVYYFTTFEGDNTVLMNLVAKNRLTEFRNQFGEMNVLSLFNYVVDQAKTSITYKNPFATRNTDENHLIDSEFHIHAFTFREKEIQASAAKRIKKLLDSGLDSFDAFNIAQHHLINVSQAYLERIVCHN